MPEAQLKVALLKHTKDPERVCAAAARQCYSEVGVKELQEEISDEKVRDLLGHVMKAGHHSVIEHASFTFGIEGISRACSHQLVRHRLASYSQQSQRYVNPREFEYVVPPAIKEDPEKLEKFKGFMNESIAAYKAFIDEGIKKEDARFVLPNAAATKIVVTMNARELLHFFNLRLSKRAQWEIRALAQAMLDECVKVAPTIFKHAQPA